MEKQQEPAFFSFIRVNQYKKITTPTVTYDESRSKPIDVSVGGKGYYTSSMSGTLSVDEATEFMRDLDSVLHQINPSSTRALVVTEIQTNTVRVWPSVWDYPVIMTFMTMCIFAAYYFGKFVKEEESKTLDESL